MIQNCRSIVNKGRLYQHPERNSENTWFFFYFLYIILFPYLIFPTCSSPDLLSHNPLSSRRENRATPNLWKTLTKITVSFMPFSEAGQSCQNIPKLYGKAVAPMLSKLLSFSDLGLWGRLDSLVMAIHWIIGVGKFCNRIFPPPPLPNVFLSSFSSWGFIWVHLEVCRQLCSV